VEIRVLGPLEVIADGLTVVIGRRRERGLLGILALHAGELVTFDRLYDLLWEGDPPDSAATQLRANASRVRAAIAAGGYPHVDELIVTRGRGFLLRLDPAKVDVWRFRRMVETAEELPAADRAQLLDEALALWRGPILAGSISDQLRDRLAPELDELRYLAIETKARAELAVGRPQRALTTTQSMSELHPHRESLVRLHMQALVQAGRRAEALHAYQRLKTRLAEDLGVDPDPETTELYVAVLRDEQPGPVADIPAQLPPPPSGFTGREEELDALLNMIGRRTATVVVVTGPAGVGKTGLAAHLAHRLAAGYPEGQLYANLGGSGPLDGLAQFLRSLGVANDKVPTRLDEAAALFRSLMAQRRMLIMLDNAHSAEQVRPLLPGNASCLVLVTSRDSLSGLVALDGAGRLVLQPLSAGAAIELLGLIAGPQRLAVEPEAAHELAQLCGLLPLALRIAGANLGDVPARTVAEQVALMRANPWSALEVAGDEERGVRVAFDQSYGALEEPARQLFRLVSLTPGHDFSAEGAIALAGDPAAESWLVHLVDVHLLTLTATRRYAMHDLIRAYARQRLSLDEADSSAVRDRVALWYVDGAAAAAALLQPASLRAYPGPADRFADADAARAWLDAERTNLVAAARQYAHEGPSWASWRIADAIGQDLAKRIQLIDLEAVATAARQTAQTAGDDVGRAVCELNFGRASWVVASYADAQKHFEAAAEAAARRWPHGVAEANRGLGNVALESGRLPEAAELYERALALVDEREAPSFHGSLSNNLGLVAAYLGQLETAAARFESVMRWARESGSVVTLGQVLSNLGEVYRNMGRYSEAIPLIDEAVQIHRQMGNFGNEVICLTQLAQAEIDGGNGQRATDMMETIQERVLAAGDPILTAKMLHAQGTAAISLRRYAEAQGIYEKMLAIADSVGHHEIELNARISLAQIALGRGHYVDADAQAAAAADRAGEVQHGQHVVECMVVQAQARQLGGPAAFGASSLAAAEELARRALAGAQRAGLRLHTAHALTILGHLTDGVPAWQQAHDIYAELRSPRAGELAALLRSHGNGLAMDRP
jgi:DNA-binding SARP family transcriptional activator